MDPELAEAVLLEHFRQPRCQDGCEGDEVCTETKDNPLCGDVITVRLERGSAPEDSCSCVSYEGQGCALSQAGASIVLSAMKDHRADELPDHLRHLITDLEAGNATNWDHESEEIIALFFAAAQNPARIRCACLGAETLLAALESAPRTQ